MADLNRMFKNIELQKMWTQKAIRSEFQTDSKDRRTGIERRCFNYTDHVPDKRSGIDRRKMLEASY